MRAFKKCQALFPAQKVPGTAQSGKRAWHFLHGYAVVTAVATFLLLIAGSLVTSTGSGLAVPDWPLSFGQWFPPMEGGVFYEHGHRMAAAVVGLMILALAVWLGTTEPRRWVRRLGYGALGAVVLQALLGGLTVLLRLPPPISIVHATLGPTVFCLVVCLAWCTSPRWPDRPVPADDRPWPSMRTLGVLTAHVALAQLILGAIIRHTGYAVFAHLLVAMLLVGCAGWCAQRASAVRDASPAAWAFAWRLAALVTMQLVVGLSVFMHRGSLPLRTAHAALGALVLAQAVVLAWEAVRGSSPVPSAMAAPAASVEARG